MFLCSYAVIQVEIKNEGEDAFKPEIYGDVIIVERRISVSTSSTVLKDHQGFVCVFYPIIILQIYIYILILEKKLVSRGSWETIMLPSPPRGHKNMNGSLIKRILMKVWNTVMFWGWNLLCYFSNNYSQSDGSLEYIWGKVLLVWVMLIELMFLNCCLKWHWRHCSSLCYLKSGMIVRCSCALRC